MGAINHLITKFGDDDTTILYYAHKTIEKKWSRELLASAVAMKMHISIP